MTKIVVHNATDPAIGIVLEELTSADKPYGPYGFYGECTQCGRPMFRWNRMKAIDSAQRHVDSHEPVLIGGDTDALVR